MKLALRIGALLVALAAIAMAMVSNLKTGPIVAQTSADLDLAYRLEQMAPPVAWLALVMALSAALWQWRHHAQRWGRVVLALGLLLSGVAVWASSIKVVQRMFEPLVDARFVSVAEADYLTPEDLVLGFEYGGEALIYPVTIIGYHHIANERLQGEPFVVTY